MMEEFIYIDKTFERLVKIDAEISNREFDTCRFLNCDFSNSVFTDCAFIDCTFQSCNLSMAKLPKSRLETVAFKDCKLLGIRFDECDDFLFGVDFYGSTLDYSWFNGKKMKETGFNRGSFKGVNFSNCDLTKAGFWETDLDGAIFDNTILSGADFSTAYNYKIDPEYNPMQKAVFSSSGISGLLEKYDIRIE